MPHPNIKLIETWVSLMITQRYGLDPPDLRIPDAVVEDVAMQTKNSGYAEIQRFYREIIGAFPDYSVRIHAAVADEYIGGVEFNFSGTHLGDAWGVPPTRRKMDIRGATIMHFVDGRIKVQHDYWSLSEYYEQLGIVPPG